MIGETLEMILGLIDAESDRKEILLEVITDTILKHVMPILGVMGKFAKTFVHPQCEAVRSDDPYYDCNGNGSRECGDLDCWVFKCNNNNVQCEHNYKFGEMLLDHSCRCKR